MKEKKKYLSLVLAILFIMAAMPITVFAEEMVEINEVNFPDKTFRAYVSRYDVNKDQNLSSEEISAVTAIKIEINIRNFEGLKFFTKLEELSISSLYVTSLDLSSNTELKKLSLLESTGLSELELTHNIQLKSLTIWNSALPQLDLSSNKALTYVELERNKALSRLLLSNNSNLTILEVSQSPALTNLDLSQVTALKFLKCTYNTGLTSLDLSNNTALTYLDLGANSSMTNLNMSQNTSLTYLSYTHEPIRKERPDLSRYPELTSLTYADRDMTSLDLSGNPVLETLNCNNNKNLISLNLSGNPALKYLYCSFNALTGLDLSNNPALINVACNRNKIESLDISEKMQLKKLECYSNIISDLNFNNCPLLTSLDCYGNLLTSIDFSGSQALTTVNCGANALNNIDISHNTMLSKFYCSYNNLTSFIGVKSEKNIDVSAQHTNAEVRQAVDGWKVDMKEIVGDGNLQKVQITLPRENFQYDSYTGIVTIFSDEAPKKLQYRYNEPYTNMYVEVKLNFEQADRDDVVVMREDSGKAFINWVIAATTKYGSGYARIKNVGGTIQVPLRYIAEVNRMTVDYDQATESIKITNAQGEYLLVTLFSKTVKKYSAEGILLNTVEAPLAFTTDNGITMGPLRFTCEALGMNVAYEESVVNGNYVAVYTQKKTDVQVHSEIINAMNYGL